MFPKGKWECVVLLPICNSVKREDSRIRLFEGGVLEEAGRRQARREGGLEREVFKKLAPFSYS